LRASATPTDVRLSDFFLQTILAFSTPIEGKNSNEFDATVGENHAQAIPYYGSALGVVGNVDGRECPLI
jgi:hypothetical protein